MKRVTARELVREKLGVGHLSQQRVDEAVKLLQDEGWTLGSHPTTREPTRQIVAVRNDEPIASLLRITFIASQAQPSGFMDIPRLLVENKVGPLTDLDAGRRLGQRGVLLLGVTPDLAKVVSVSPELASIVNDLRYRQQTYRREVSTLIRAVLHLEKRPKRLTRRHRSAAVAAFKRFFVDAKELRSNDAKVRIYSAWRFGEGEEQK